jgi:hypothetical protein
MAQPALPPPGFDELSPDEKLEYIQALWDHSPSIPRKFRCLTGAARSSPSASLPTVAAK